MSKQLYHYKRDGKGKGKRESSSTTHHPARGEGVHSLCRCTDGQNCQHFPRMRECAAIQVYANLNSASSIEFALMLKYPRRRHLQNEHIRHLEARYNLLLLSLFWTSLTASRSITPPPNFASSDTIQASIGLKAPQNELIHHLQARCSRLPACYIRNCRLLPALQCSCNSRKHRLRGVA